MADFISSIRLLQTICLLNNLVLSARLLAMDVYDARLKSVGYRPLLRQAELINH